MFDAGQQPQPYQGGPFLKQEWGAPGPSVLGWNLEALADCVGTPEEAFEGLWHQSL